MGSGDICEGFRMRILWLAALAAISLSSGYAQAAGTVPAKTRAVTIDAAAMTTTQRARGHCWTSSIASRRSDAYRCMVGNAIHDPCFTIDTKSVACPLNPSTNTGLRITLTKPLPPSNAENVHNAWTMQLAGGALCTIGTGTVIPDYPFYCTGKMVCAAPPATNRDAVFVSCGKPKSALKVKPGGHYLVTVMYE
jgi:hypothetical protein